MNRHTYKFAFLSAALCTAMVVAPGCNNDFLRLEDYQRDLILGALAAALLSQQAPGGAAGQPIPGADGLTCWDLNGNGVADDGEDVNGDGIVDTLDCQGAAGALGGDGTGGGSGLNCWDLNGNGTADGNEDTNGDGVVNVFDCRGEAGADGADGGSGSPGSPGTDGPVFFDVFIDDFFIEAPETAGLTEFGVVPIDVPTLGTPGDAHVAFRVAIPARYRTGNDVTLRLFFYRTGPFDGDCFIFTLDAVRLRDGFGIEMYGARRWVRVDLSGTTIDPGVGVIVDLPINTPAGLGFPNDLAAAHFLAMELGTDLGDGGTYELRAAEFIESSAGSAARRGSTIFSSDKDVSCEFVDCNGNGIPDDVDIEMGFGPGNILYGSHGGDTCYPLIFTIDPTTGVVTEFVDLDDFGPPVSDIDTCGLTGLTLSDDGGTLYVSNRYDPVIFLVDTETATVDVLFLTPAPLPGVAALVGGDLILSDLAFLPDGRLVGSAPRLQSLVVINPDTGAYTELCQTVVMSKGPDPTSLSGLALSPGGVLYGSTGGQEINPNHGTVYTVDVVPDGMGHCLLTPLGQPTGFGQVSGLDFGPDGRLFGSTGYGTDRVTPELIEIDLQTGLGTLVAEMSGDSLLMNIDGIAFSRESFGTDCNGNGIPDECDIRDCGPEDAACADCNSNGIPDECEIVVDGTSASLITFEAADSYTIGDGIAEINAIISLQGIEVRAVANELGLVPPLLNVAAHPNGGGNQVLNARTHPNGADILFNFSTPVSFFRVEFVDNLSGTFNVSLIAFDHTDTALGIVGTPSLGSVSGAEPTFLEFSNPNIRAVQLESGSQEIVVDNIEFVAALDCNNNGVPDECEPPGADVVTYDPSLGSLPEDAAPPWNVCEKGDSIGGQLTPSGLLEIVDDVDPERSCYARVNVFDDPAQDAIYEVTGVAVSGSRQQGLQAVWQSGVSDGEKAMTIIVTENEVGIAATGDAFVSGCSTALDTTDQLHTYRIVKHGQSHVEVLIDGLLAFSCQYDQLRNTSINRALLEATSIIGTSEFRIESVRYVVGRTSFLECTD